MEFCGLALAVQFVKPGELPQPGEEGARFASVFRPYPFNCVLNFGVVQIEGAHLVGGLLLFRILQNNFNGDR